MADISEDFCPEREKEIIREETRMPTLEQGEKLRLILQRVDSRLLSKLWLFYRDYFKNDESCLEFFFCAVTQEPVYTKEDLEEQFSHALFDDNYVDPDDHLFIPRRMLNCVQRMVSAARDMEQIRQGKDVFKIVFLVTCVETLKKLSGKDGFKKDMLFDFFETNTSSKDKNYIRKHFAHGEQGLYPDEDGFWQFISVLSEYRNAAAHEGQYWDTCFKNYSSRTPLSIMTKAQLDKDSKKAEHVFETTMSYRKFDEIFVRTCISFIRNYVASQEEIANADA